MPPINRMRAWDVAFIRPLAYVREKDVLRLVQARGIPFSGCNCPVWEDRMRNKIKREIVWVNEKVLPNYVENTFWALIKDFKEKYEKEKLLNPDKFINNDNEELYYKLKNPHQVWEQYTTLCPGLSRFLL